jgi:transcriptional regulator
LNVTVTLRVLSDAECGPHLDALIAKCESWLPPKPPWTSSKMTAGRLDAMKKAIVGLVMTVDEVEGSFKLNQHKSDVDHTGVTNALALQSDAAARAIGEQMVALRPQLNYISPLGASEPADGRNVP